MTPDHDLWKLLLDDCPYGDLTTEGLQIGDTAARATLTARDAMIPCALEEAARLFVLAGASARVLARDGVLVEPETVLIEVEGPGRAIHAAYKVAQTLLEVLSGISTATRDIVNAARSAGHARVCCTRKHMPGIKSWALQAIEAGGATPHRLGLSDFVLVFDQHRALLPADADLAAHFARLAQMYPERRVTAEANSVEEALALADAGAEIIQLDKMSPDAVAEVVRAMSIRVPRPLVSIAGGVNATNAAAYAATGADILVTSAPYYAPPRDVKVRIKRASD